MKKTSPHFEAGAILNFFALPVKVVIAPLLVNVHSINKKP